jgi:hypothetical protein
MKNQNIPIDVNAAAANIFNRVDNLKTTLMGYFERNRTDENACHLLYV